MQITYAQFAMRIGYNYANPMGMMAVNIQQGHGIGFDLSYRLPKMPLRIGFEMALNVYGSQRQDLNYVFQDGSQVETHVEITNNFANFNLLVEYDLLPNSPISPYISLKAGYSPYWTKLFIADPNDTDACRPIENTNLARDGAFTRSIGVGLRTDLAIFSKKMPKEFLYLDINCHYTVGGNVSYMSIDAPTSRNIQYADEVVANFQNPNNLVVHQHHVGYLYNSPIEMLNVNATLGVMFGW